MAELLQQIVINTNQTAKNTSPTQTRMISIASTKPEFSVNFPSPVPVSELALAKLRVYHSWPNIRSEAFAGQQPNNSLVFAWRNSKDGTPDWQVVSIPTGSYQIEQINNEFQRRIKSLTGKESKIAISVHEPTLSSTIEISTEGYVVDIYRSSIRTILGWPEQPPRRKETVNDYESILEFLPKQRFDSLSDNYDRKQYLKKSYRDFTIKLFITMEKAIYPTYYTTRQEEIDKNFTAMKNDFNLLLTQLESGTLTKDEFINTAGECNQIIWDMVTFNNDIVKGAFAADGLTREEFIKKYNITDEEFMTGGFVDANLVLQFFRLPGYDNNLKDKLDKSIDVGLKKIIERKKNILAHNNSPERDGRHIAPNNVNISSVIALNLTCDAIEGSYQINLEQSNQAQQGYILYSFAPTAPPGFLIVEDPVNPVYMRCHNNFLTSVNFRLTDQANNLIDLRGEVLAISLFVKS